MCYKASESSRVELEQMQSKLCRARSQRFLDEDVKKAKDIETAKKK